MNLLCDYHSCQKSISNSYYICLKCNDKFCSDDCKVNHSFQTHQNVGRRISVMRNSNLKSSFMKSGEYLKEIQNDALYDFENFEFLKSNNKNQIIGSGAFGDVLLARNKINNNLYAIKQMTKLKVIQNGESLDIITREIDVHRRLIHENIVKMYSYHEDKEAFYIIMEYVSGGTLFNLIKRTNGMDEKQAFRFFISAVSALSFLHANNFVHRDLKPENLLLDENGVVKLCDFGWCVRSDIGSRSTFCGTFEYMAPEIINENAYDNSIDVWSLGILLYELIHGYSPFRAKKTNCSEDYIEIFKNIVKFNFKIEKQLSENCTDLLKKLLSTDVKIRIKIRDIFLHPWVIGFDTFEKVQKVSVFKDEKGRISKCLKTSNDNKKTELKDANRIQENERKKELINKDKNNLSLSIFQSNNNQTLFEKVLNQVKEKNMKKRRKSEFVFEPKKNIEDKLLNAEKEVIDHVESNNNLSISKQLSLLEEKIDKLQINYNDKSFLSAREECYTYKDKNDCKNKPKLKSIEFDKENNFLIHNTCNDLNVFNNSNLESKKLKKKKKITKSNFFDQIINSNNEQEKRIKESQVIHKFNYSYEISKSIDIEINASNYRYSLDKNELEKDLNISVLTHDLIFPKQKISNEKKNLLASLEILERVQGDDYKLISNKSKKKKSFWSFMNSCNGKNHN